MRPQGTPSLCRSLPSGLAWALVWLAVMTVGARADPVAQYFYQGAVAQERGDFDTAIPNWNAVLKLNPNDIAAYKNRGVAYLYKDDWNHSIDDYTEVIRRKVDDVAAFDGRGYAHFQKQDWEEAISDFESAIRLNPRNWGLYRNLGRVYLTMGDWDRAITNFTIAIRLNPLDDWSYNCRAIAQEDKGNLTAAIADFETAVRISPGYANVYLNCGNLFRYHKNSLDVAIADYNEAARLDPTNADILAVRAGAWFARRDYDRALTDYNTVIRLAPGNAAHYFERGQFEEWTTNYDAAAADFTNAIQFNPTNAGYWDTMGDFHERMTNYDAAIADFGHCIDLQPTNGENYASRAEAEEKAAGIWAKAGDHEKRTAALDQAQNDWTQAAAWDAHYLNSLGRFECRKGLYDAGIADFTEYIAAYPANDNGWISRAVAYEKLAADDARQGDLAGRTAALERGLADWTKLVSQDPNFLYLRGNFQARTHDFAKALADYRQCVQLCPSNSYAWISLGWFLATCPERSDRNGYMAVKMAKRAGELISYPSGFHLAGLAAACAETGDYARAVDLQEQALAVADFGEGMKADMLHRLALYKEKRPCHKIPGLEGFE